MPRKPKLSAPRTSSLAIRVLLQPLKEKIATRVIVIWICKLGIFFALLLLRFPLRFPLKEWRLIHKVPMNEQLKRDVSCTLLSFRRRDAKLVNLWAWQFEEFGGFGFFQRLNFSSLCQMSLSPKVWNLVRLIFYLFAHTNQKAKGNCPTENPPFGPLTGG